MKIVLTTLSGPYRALALSLGFTLAVLLVRIQITHSVFYLFLVWNLMLAGIPYAITQCLRLWPVLLRSKGVTVLGFSLWLLFLPNSPYIITDLVHLHNDHSILVWLDMFLVFVFALNGLLLGLFSLVDMFGILEKKNSEKGASTLIFLCCLLSGYGVYLGRFLRFNSWDALTRPLVLLNKIALSLHQPKVWLMTLAFGGFLWILFLLVKDLNKKTSS